MSTDPPSSGASVLRIRWLPGADVLQGTCHCDARHECRDPVEMWDWLLAHPDHPAREDGPGERHA
ncbi:MAG: hypothetical protein HOY69_31500 [Streptomyces sp.]|nr:hypothetical protein [Streptomyces sp.]